jgi:hypothetical protein
MCTVGQAAAQARVPIPMAKDMTFQMPDGWKVVKGAFRNATELIKTAKEKKSLVRIAHLLVTTEVRRSHEEALQRLREISAESKAQARAVSVGGWPGIQRTEVVVLPRTEHGEEQKQAENDQKVEKIHPLAPTTGISVTVAVAVGDRVVRFDGMTASEKDHASADEVLRAAEALVAAAKPDPQQTAAEVQQLKRNISARPRASGSGAAPVSRAGKGRRRGLATPSAAVQVQSGIGELEVAVTHSGQDVVIAANSGWSRSHNGGVTYSFGGSTPGTFPRDGDPSLAVAASGNIYYAFIGFPDGSAGAGGVNGCSDSVARSTDGGTTFPFLAHAVFCPLTAANLCFPDQEHIGGDRFTAGADQLYVVWRQFSPAGSPPDCSSISSGFVTPSIVCSSNGGTAWTAPLAIGTGDRPRVAVGRDGFVYVAYRSGLAILVNKFSSCGSGLVQQPGFPVTVVMAPAEVACPLAGLDRCNSFGSPTVAPDDLDPRHLYLAYAVNTSASNDNVMVHQSTDGGATWSAPIQVNTPVPGRRFMPWACAIDGTVQVGWYDRRAASAAAVDLTDYYLGSALVKDGVLQANSEINLTGASDPQCASGWPFSVDSPTESETCNVQPQFAGRCLTAAGTGSNAPCDFSSGPACAAGETCQALGGAPKYGDYNGIACGSERVYTAWTSATPPAGTQATGSGLRIFSNVSPALMSTGRKADYCRRVGDENLKSSYVSCTLSSFIGFGGTITSGVVDWGYDAGVAWADFDGDGKADYCRRVGDENLKSSYVSCTLSTGTGFGATITSGVVDWGYDPGAAWVDVNGDGKADYCRRVGDENLKSSYVSCTLSTGTGFGATITSGVIDWGYDAGVAWVDVNGDGKADYCRRVGDENLKSSYVSCTLSTGTGFGATITSGVVDWGYDSGVAWADANGDGKADYCRRVGDENLKSSYVSCTLSTGTGFGATIQSGVVDWGYDAGVAWADFDGDGKADYCRRVGDENLKSSYVSCTLSTGAGFGSTLTSGVVDWGYDPGVAWVDVNGDGKADYCRRVGDENLKSSYVSCTLSTGTGFGGTVTSGVVDWGYDAGVAWADANGS